MSTGNDVVDDLVKQWNQRLSNVGPKAVLINLGVTAVLSLVVIVVFSILRPNNQIVYAPKYKYSPDHKRPPKISKGFLSWLSPLVSVKETWMMDRIGMDAVVYLRFVRMLRWMFLVIAALSCGVLIPANVIYNVKKVHGDDRNYLSMLSIQSVQGNLLYLHVTLTYLIHGIVYFFIWINYRRVVELRWHYFRSPEFQEALFARSIMISRVARRLQSDEGLAGLLQSLQIPYPTESVHLDRRIAELPELIEAHSDSVRQLEQVLTTYLKDGKIGHKRPTLKKGAFLGIGGEQHDAIDYLTTRIQKLEGRIDNIRENVHQGKPQQYGFASFEKAPYAQIVAKKLAKKKYKGAVIELAPRPTDIIWKNLEKSDSTRHSHAFIGGVLLAFVMVLYVAPLVAVSALSNLASLTVYVKFLEDWSNSSSFTFSAVAGILPPFLSILLQLILPIIMRSLTRFQGATTKTRLDRAVLARYFFFLVIFQFFIFSLLGVFFNLITQIVLQKGHVDIVLRELQQLPDKIQLAYVQQGNYWLTWFPTRGFSAIFELAQAVSLLYTWMRAKIFGRTPRQIREWCAPTSFDYAVYATNVLFMCLVALVYAPLVPLVTLTAAGAFFASSFVSKYMLLYINVTKVESGGRLWRMLINRLLFCLIIMQLLMCLTVGLQVRWLNCIAAAPPIFFVFGYKWYLNRQFGEKFRWYIPSQSEIADIREHHSDDRKNRLAKRFGHPSLHAELMTPMVHKEIEHLLAQVYTGRLDAESPVLAENKNGQHVLAAGGLTFAAIDTLNLELTRDEYLRQNAEDEWETSSMASSALTKAQSPMHVREKGYFDVQRQQYLANGPGGVLATPPESIYSQTGRVSPASRASQENLLAHAAAAPYSHSPYGAYAGAPTNSRLNLGMTASRSSVDLSAYIDPRETLYTHGPVVPSPPQRYSLSRTPPPLHQHVPQSGPGYPGYNVTRGRAPSTDSLNSQQYWSPPQGPPNHYPAEPSYPPVPSRHSPASSAGSLPPGAVHRAGSPSSNLTFGILNGSPVSQGQPQPPPGSEGRRPPRHSNGSGQSMQYW